MDNQQLHNRLCIEHALLAERQRLVRFCAHLTGNGDAAEDLAQETLLAAWRQIDDSQEIRDHQRWLAGIARNKCRHWSRQRRYESERRVWHAKDDSADPYELASDNDQDIELELERSELVSLLDRALARLTPDVRQALIQKYVEESPHAEIAKRLGLSEGAVAMRIHRGKLALRRLLTTTFAAEATDYGVEDSTDDWKQLRQWCPHCGKQRLIVRYDAQQHELSVRCPGCTSDAGRFLILSNHIVNPFKSYWPLLTKIMSSSRRLYSTHVARAPITCGRCAAKMLIRATSIEDTRPNLASWLGDDTPPQGTRVISGYCEQCGLWNWAYSTETALYLPEGLRFWQRRRRIRTLPEREITYEGRNALLTQFVGVHNHAQLTVIYDRTTYEVLRIDEIPH